MRNAYWDGKKIHAPAAVKDLPDIVYHEAPWPFIQKRWSFSYRGQEGALAQSYTDVLTSLVKQKKLGQTAQEADWTIAPGAIAWITGNKIAMHDDLRPLVSLKAPGTAYDDKVVGKDPQPAHFSKLVVAEADNGGIHVNSGIPNKAFYEATIRIGSEKAGKIWIESLSQFKAKTDILQAAKIIHQAAVRLYGKDSGEEKAVQQAWNAVGLLEQRP